MNPNTKEQQRLKENYNQQKNWLKWGPYLSERQWGTVREDYSAEGKVWESFPHDEARSRVYRWGEDGIAGICDELCRLCFSIAFWNGKDPIIKERLFGLTGPEGNHAEDVKELYYYLDSTPTHSYMKHLYKYPQTAFPYADLVQTNQKRSKREAEYEILNTKAFEQNRYFDIFTEYAKGDEEDILIKVTIHNRGKEAAPITILPTIWFRNLWDFGLLSEKPNLKWGPQRGTYETIQIEHPELGQYSFHFKSPDRVLFTENETNTARIFNHPNETPFVKDSINDAVISGNFNLLASKKSGTKASPLYQSVLPSGASTSIKLRLTKNNIKENPLGSNFDKLFLSRQQEANDFYTQFIPSKGDKDLQNIQRQAFAGMMWTKQYYNMDIPRWLNGDPGQPKPSKRRKKGRNREWFTLNNEDIISMPDKWEYPWYAAWDLAFHCVPIAMIDPDFAKQQLILFLREWYMRPNGQIPAYEWNFSDVNPPVHAWACMEVYRIEQKRTGKGDVDFLKRVFQKLLINFTWWVNQKDHNENNIFEGGFLGLDNIGVFDRSAEIPGGGFLEQADGTSWMAMYCLNMLDMAIEIAQVDTTFEDVATKFLEHFVIIADSLNQISTDWPGAWDEKDGFFYDILTMPDGRHIPVKVRSLVGLSTMFATMVLDKRRLKKIPTFHRRLEWYRHYRQENNFHVVIEALNEDTNILLSLIPRNRLKKMLHALLDEQEFLSPLGIRSLSKIHQIPYRLNIDGQQFSVKYEPAESSNHLFGGNSNWRGPIWMPMNYLILQSLQQFHHYFGDDFRVDYPTASNQQKNLGEIVENIARRLIQLFQKDNDSQRPIHQHETIYQNDPHFTELLLFYEYFHGDTGRGVGASHQTGWTGIMATLIEEYGWK